MRRYMPILAALAIGAVSTTAMAAGTYGATAPDAGVRTSTTVMTGPDDSGVLTNTAVAETFDAALGQRFEVERAIVDRAEAAFGKSATFSSGRNLAPSIEDQIVQGNALPSAVPIRPAPEALGDLPTLQGGDRWVAAGEHLIEVTPDNRIAMVVYDVLP